ncbi:SDR family NAD(P)-dependent oxidoreductase [Rhizobium laguerreae]|nr:SDR family NAD(P)-dependent oxidoreductase [Rhizobium laguerreae]
MRAQKTGLIINVSSVLGFLPAPFMGIYAASKHALEGMSKSLDHEIREFGVRVVLLEPTSTNTKLEVNAAQTAAPIGVYASQFQATVNAVQNQIKSAPSAHFMAQKIADVIAGRYKLRQPVGGEATLLARVRRFMSARAVDGSLRKTLGFAKGIDTSRPPPLTDPLTAP